MISKEEFIIQHLTKDKKYQDFLDENPGLIRKQLSEWWEEELELREEIKKSNQLFAAKIGKEEFSEFKEMGKRGFYEWYHDQPKKCAYCGIEEYKLKALFNNESGILSTKRKRGRFLELERKDADTNKYSPQNCVLACYLCNNHKSDLISEEDHKTYFAKAIKDYLDNKYQLLNDNRSE